MTAKEKAEELYERFFYSIPSMSDEGQLEDEISKKCALISADEIMKTLIDLSNGEFSYIYEVKYWQDVKKEISSI